MKCIICNKEINSQYYTDDKKQVFCSDTCYNKTLPTCCICDKQMKQWTESKGRKFCSEKCISTTLPTCFICGKRMEQWTESEGKKYCSEECFTKTLPTCSVCGKRMKKWTESEGEKYCSDECFSKTLPTCSVCGKSMQHWTESDGKKLCSEKCISQTWPTCFVCGKHINEWLTVDEACYCNKNCLSKTFKYYRSDDIENKMKQLGYSTLDVLLIGATGVGKSATINSLLKSESAEVGHGTDPKTMKIGNFLLSSGIQIWDTPGLGDSLVADKEHSEKIINHLKTRISGDDSYGFIDMTVMVIEAGIRDMGTVFELINNILLPHMKDAKRIVIGLNQADFAMKGKYFNYTNNSPEDVLLDFLEEKTKSIQKRIKEASSIDVNVTYYSAETGYNVTKFLDLIIDHIPEKKRYISTN